jgi:hypothetical protein
MGTSAGMTRSTLNVNPINKGITVILESEIT